MLLRITLVMEILAVIICIHCVYGEKIELDIDTIVLFLILLVILDIVNKCESKNIISLIVYVPIWIYCKRKFKNTVGNTIINLMVFLVVFIILQFGIILILNAVLPKCETVRTFIANVITLWFCIFILPRMHVNRISEYIQRYKRFTYLIVSIVFAVVAVILLQVKIVEGIQTELFVFAIPVIVLLLLIFVKWGKAQVTVENLEKEKLETINGQGKYEKLLMEVRMRQHAFKNHVAAIFSAQYTCDTYDKLVKTQEEYYRKIREENRYNCLLLLENNVLGGFLYGKFQEIEDDGIELDCKIESKIENYDIPTYKLIEMLGILLDNAVEALKDRQEDREICVIIEEAENEYCFKVSNKFRYVPYNEIEEWFKLGKSDKGLGRGIGLYHLKTLCDAYGCNIICRNMKKNDVNRVEFILTIAKARCE